MAPRIIFEDEELLVLDKPAGWIVNEATTTKSTPVIQTWISKNFDFPLASDGEFRNGIVHRLDKETSGVLLVAKTQEAMINLQSQFKERKVKKIYLALVHGKVDPTKGEVNAPIGRLTHNRKRFGIVPGGKPAVTSYEVDNYYQADGGIYTMLSLRPKTGRTHQIRVHTKYLGHPVVADEFYAGRKTSRNDRKWCPRLFLHASGIEINNPTSGREEEYKSELPKDLAGSLTRLKVLK